MAAVLGTAESLVLGAFSQSTGSVLIDGAIGGAAGYFLAPRSERNRYALGGAIATGLGGALGLVATLGFIWATKHDRKSNPRRRRRRSV
jgi:hypothetical protein